MGTPHAGAMVPRSLLTPASGREGRFAHARGSANPIPSATAAGKTYAIANGGPPVCLRHNHTRATSRLPGKAERTYQRCDKPLPPGEHATNSHHKEEKQMLILPFHDKVPQIDPSAFLAQGVVVSGDVTIGADTSIWYNGERPG